MQTFKARSSVQKSSRNRLYAAAAVAAAILVTLYLLTLFGLNTLSGMRAFVEGEGLYTKHQRDAVRTITRYVRTGDEASYQSFQQHLDILDDLRLSRLELDKNDPNLAVVHAGFLKLGLDRRDMDNMVNVYRRFHGFEHVSKAISDWKAADDELDKLRVIGDGFHSRKAELPLERAALEEALKELEESNNLLNEAERNFSASLGAAAHWALSVLTAVMLGFTMGAGGILAWMIVAGHRLISKNDAIAAGMAQQVWVREGIAALHEATKGAPLEEALCNSAIRSLCDHLDATVGAIYVLSQDETLRRRGGHGIDDREAGPDRFSMGQGLVGQAAVDAEIRIIDDLPEEHLRVRSGLGSSSPPRLLLVPTLFEDHVNGVIELGTAKEKSRRLAATTSSRLPSLWDSRWRRRVRGCSCTSFSSRRSNRPRSCRRSKRS